MGLTDCVQCQRDLTWQVLLPTWEALIPWERPQLRLLVLGADDPKSWRRLASWANTPNVSVTAVAEDDPRHVPQMLRDYPEIDFHGSWMDLDSTEPDPYDALVSLRPQEFVDFAWLRLCTADAVVGCPIQPIDSPWRWTLLCLQLAGGLIVSPQTAFVPWPDHGHEWLWQVCPVDPILSARDHPDDYTDCYWVHLPPPLPEPSQPAGPAVRWITTLVPDQPAHLASVGPTRGTAWQAVCGQWFNPGLDAARDHSKLCRACLDPYLAGRQALAHERSLGIDQGPSSMLAQHPSPHSVAPSHTAENGGRAADRAEQR